MKRTPAQLLKNYLLILVGAAVYALAFDAFFVPNGIAFGGVTGLAQIANFFLPQVPVGTLVILFNIPLFLLGWKLLGGHMLVSSLFAMTVSSLFIDLYPMFYTFPPMEDTLLACLIGGVVLGVGLAILLRFTGQVLSGVIFFSDNAWDGWAAWAYSLTYHLSSKVPEGIVSAAVLSSLPLGAMERALKGETSR